MTYRKPFCSAVAALLIAAVAGLSSAVPARADSLRLTLALRDHLATLHPLAGRKLHPRQLHDRAVLVAFFSSWCKPCNTDFEHLKMLQLSYAAQGLTIVAVDMNEHKGPAGDTPDAAKRLDHFLARHAPVFSVVRGTAETAKLFGGVTALPRIVVFGRDGRPRLDFTASPGNGNAGLKALHDAIQNGLGIGAAWLPDATGGPLVYRMTAGDRQPMPLASLYSLGLVPRAHSSIAPSFPMGPRHKAGGIAILQG